MQWIYIFFALFISFLWGLQPVVHKHLLKRFNSVSMMMFTAIITPTKKKNETKRSYDLYIL